MTLSYSRDFEVQCPKCGEDLNVEVWFAIDIIERPDLLQRCVDDSIHTFVCSHGHSIRVGAPLLLIDRGPPRLLFFAVGDDSPEKVEQAAASLLAQVRTSASGAASGLPDRIEIIPRSRLRMALNGKTQEEIDRFDSVLKQLSLTGGFPNPRFRGLCEQALDILHREDDPPLWAALQNDLASSMLVSSEHDSAEEAEHVIEAATKACSVFTRSGFPDDWARAQHTLAMAFSARVQGDRAENLERAIRAAEAALSAVTRKAEPERFAAIQMVLGRAYKDRRAGDPQANLSRAEEAYVAALQAFNPEESPAEYAAIRRELGKLGILLAGKSSSDRDAGNSSRLLNQLTQSIGVYRELAARDPKKYASDLAETLYDLGKAHWMQGELPAARDAFASAVEEQRRLVGADRTGPNPELARALSALGEIYSLLKDPQQSRECLAESAAIYQSLVTGGAANYLSDLGFVLSDLGKSQTPGGEISLPHSGELADARQSFAQAADIFRSLLRQEPDDTLYQYEFATALHALATCELTLLGDHPDEESLRRYRDRIQEAIDVFRGLDSQEYDLHTGELAMALNNLGSACRQLDDIDAARRAYTEATSTVGRAIRQDHKSSLEPLVTSFTALGMLHLGTNEYVVARTHFENAVVCLRRLRQLSPGEYEQALAGTLDLLGQVQDSLGDEETARACFESALEIRQARDRGDRPADSPLGAAVSLINLANVRRKMKGLDGALDNCAEAMRLLAKHGEPKSDHDAELVGSCLVNASGIAIAKGGYEMATRLLEQATDIFRKLSRRVASQLPSLALALGNLGVAQMMCGDAESARASLQESLVLRRLQADLHPELFSTAVASTLMHLAMIEKHTGNSDLAVDGYTEAIEIFGQASMLSPAARAHELFACWSNLSGVYLPSSPGESPPDYRKARTALRNAVRFAELSRGRFIGIGQRRRVLGESLTAYQQLIKSCVELWKEGRDDGFLREAVEAAEASRARILSEALIDEELQPANAAVELVQEFHRVRRQLRESDRLLFEEERGRGTDVGISTSHVTLVSTNPLPPGLVLTMRGLGEVGSVEDSTRRAERIGSLKRDVDHLRGKYTELLGEVRKFDGDFREDALFAPIGYEEIRSLLPSDDTTAIVQFVLTDDRAYAFVIMRDFGTVVELPELTENWLDAFTRDWVALRQRTRAGDDSSLDQVITMRSQWREGATAMLGRLSTIMLQPILGSLPAEDIGRLILAPHGALHVLPLHACPLSSGGFLIDDFEVVYAPSLSILHHCLVRARQPSGERLVIENPTEDLPFAEVEGHCVHSHYPHAVRLHGRQATRERVLCELRTCQFLHYSGHGLFDERDPLSSALALEDRTRRSKWLSLRDVICGLRMEHNCLCVLSGCETGLLKPDVMDEYVSLPLGFLSAGSKCVVSTLWEIDDLSTALLLDRFYSEYSSGRPPAAALRSAQLWLRDEIPNGRVLRNEVVPSLLKRVNDENLCRVCSRVADEYAQLCEHSPPFVSLLHWAPFSTIGLGYHLQMEPQK